MIRGDQRGSSAAKQGVVIGAGLSLGFEYFVLLNLRLEERHCFRAVIVAFVSVGLAEGFGRGRFI